MVNAIGVEAAQRDRGEARRSDVISCPLRRLCVLCSLVGYELATKKLQRCQLCSLFSDHAWEKL